MNKLFVMPDDFFPIIIISSHLIMFLDLLNSGKYFNSGMVLFVGLFIITVWIHGKHLKNFPRETLYLKK